MKITQRIIAEIASHEACVREAYKDSVGVWTWGFGITNASGHTVYPKYKDNPQPMEKCLEVFAWALEKYAKDVDRAFQGHLLTEAQYAAALSFHYNTGAILRASWVKSWKAGKVEQARREFMNWKKPPEIIPRRTNERDLFFDGKWSNTGATIPVYERVRKPSYSPVWESRRNHDASAFLAKVPPPKTISSFKPPTPQPAPQGGFFVRFIAWLKSL